MEKEEAQERLKELIEEAEINIQELLAAEKKIKEFGVDLFSRSVQEELGKTLKRAKDTRKYYAKQLGKLDRAKKRLEDLE